MRRRYQTRTREPYMASALQIRLSMASTIWKGQLSFGLVNIPVRLQRAARKERIPMHYVSRAPHTRIADGEHVSNDSFPAQPQAPDGLPADTRVSTARASSDEEESVMAEPHVGRQSPAEVSRIKHSIKTTEDQPVRRSDLMRAYEV